MRRVEVSKDNSKISGWEGNGLEKKSSPKEFTNQRASSPVSRWMDTLDFGDKDFPVADLPGFGRLGDGVNDGLDFIIGDDRGMGLAIDGILGTAIKFGMPFLPAVT